MDLEYINYNGKVVMKNTYTFTIIDKEGNVIDKRVCHNVCMPKRYFVNNLTDLHLALGTMLPNDYLKYQSNGVWNREYAQKNDGKAGYRAPAKTETPSVDARNTRKVQETNLDGSTTTKEVDAGPAWGFKPKVKETDTGLLGTTVFNVSFNWECSSISSSSVTFQGLNEIDYHSPSSKANKEKDFQLDGAELAGTRMYVYDANGKVIGEYYSDGTKDLTPHLKGIELIDGCLVGSKGECISHFLINGGELWKRPFEKLSIAVTVSFININCYGFGTPFIPQGNAMYGHGSNFCGAPPLCCLRPFNFRFSGMPIRQCSGANGCVPIMGGISMQLDQVVTTDKPDDWDDELDGPWYGTPFYHYYGKGYPYKTKIKKKKIKENGIEKTVEVEVDSLNLKGQRQFSFKNIEEIEIGNFNIGPIRSIVLDGCAAEKAKGLIQPPADVIRGFLIGVGDGMTTRFAHSITSEIGKIVEVHTDIIDEDVPVSSVTYYNKNDNIFSKNFLKIYNGEQTIEIGANTYDSRFYDKKNKKVTFGLHPFNFDYYMGMSGLLGANEWLIYRGTQGTSIKSFWIGMNVSRSIYSDAEIVTANREEDLFSSPLGTYRLSANPVQHPDTTLNTPYPLGTFTAIKGGNGWTTLSCYVGGFRYGFYDPCGIRICSTEKVPGFIEFERPPANGTKIYIDVKFTAPFFMNDMISLKGRAYSTFGDVNFNGNDKK